MKYMKNAVLVLGAVAFLTTAQAEAGIIVDSFLSPGTGLTLNLDKPPGLGSAFATTVGSGIVGGQRNLSYSVTYMSFTTASVEVNTPTSPSRLTESSGDFATPDLVLNYDANGAGLGVNLSGTSLTLKGLVTDLPLTVKVWLTTSPGNSYTATVPVAGGYAADLTITSFTTVGAPNLNSINDIKIEFAGARGADYSLHTITVVPEPSTYSALTALGLLGTVIWRRARA